MASRRAARFYLAFQGVAVLAWWVALFALPSFERVFLPTSASPAFLYAFLTGDVLIVGFGSLVAARSRSSSAPPRLLLVVAGALWYATLYLVGLWASGEIAAAGPLLMIAASVGTGWTLAAPAAE